MGRERQAPHLEKGGRGRKLAGGWVWTSTGKPGPKALVGTQLWNLGRVTSPLWNSVSPPVIGG